ncbi:MAG TPA: ribbon-helix-helix protein, CopG family [Candidatus Atribacteria bacterium]|nr:ribbon-helix-helix protein, CopG family [Candidatus Atribacteria bacterium]
MKKVLVNIPEKFIEYIDKLIELGICPSRSEAIRSAIEDWIIKASNFLSNFSNDMLKMNDINRKFIEFRENFKRELLADYSESSFSTAKFKSLQENEVI